MQDWKIEPAKDLGVPHRERLKSLDRENGFVFSCLHLGWWGFVRCYMAAWHRLRIEGREKIPRDPPFILVANHTSHLDALVLAAPLRWRIRDHIYPIAAGDVFFETPVMTAFAAGLLNALPMWRKKCGPHALQQLREKLLNEPAAYILFPEGTRSRDGSPSAFKPGLGMLVAGTNVPIIPCHLDGCHEALGPGRKWPRRRRITLKIGDPLVFESTSNDREGWKHVAETSQAGVERLANRPAASAAPPPEEAPG